MTFEWNVFIAGLLRENGELGLSQGFLKIWIPVFLPLKIIAQATALAVYIFKKRTRSYCPVISMNFESLGARYAYKAVC